MNRFDFWTRWIEGVGWLLVCLGLAMATLNDARLFDLLFNRQIDPAFWSGGSVPANVDSFKAWVYGVLGATVAGWGVFVVFLARNPIRKRERWAWNCICLGITLWFVVDTALSAYFGVYFNVVFNSTLALLVYVPLLATRRYFD